MAITLFTTSGTVTLDECYDGYAKGRARDGGLIVSKAYELTDWSKVDAVITALMGSTSLTAGIGGTITQVPPHECPENPGLHCISAGTTDLAPLDDKAGGRPEFRKCVIQATYGTLPWNVNAIDYGNTEFPGGPYTYAIMEVKTSNESITIPNTAYTFLSDGKKSNAKHLLHIGVADLVFTRKRVPFLNLPLYLSLQNKLNNATFFGVAAGQIRFANFSTRVEALSDGTRSTEVTFVFKWREYHWNKFHRDDTKSFDTYVDGSGNNPYSLADLTPLLLQ